MHMIRRAILSLALIAGITPAFAQAPGPVPALPDTERRTSYTISASTCACSVGFQLYGDSTDYANWLTVWVNGVQVPQAGNWTITSPSGSLATLPRPITNAVLTFATAQTGTVQIVGARRPRRTSQFSENRGVAARDMNQVLSDIEAQNRELWDQRTRTVQAPPGETLNILPALSGRASMNACFDSGGNLTSCVGTSSGSFAAGNGIAFSGTNPTTITNNIQAGPGIQFTGTNPIVVSAGGAGAAYVMPSDYGIICDGSTNWATQLQTMITQSAGKTIFIPAGPDCITNTTLTLPSNTTIIGGGREVSVIKGTGSAVPVMTTTNTSNISLSNFWCKGSDNVVSWTATKIGCINIVQNNLAAGIGSNFSIQNTKFSNFNATHWINISASTSTFAMSNVIFSNNYAVTASVDMPTDGVVANNGNSLLNMFSGSAGNGRIENVSIKNNRVIGDYLCFGFSLFGNHYKYEIEGNMLLNVGNGDSGAHCTNSLGSRNAYPILVYDVWSDGNPPFLGNIVNNLILLPYSVGIYLAGDGDSTHVSVGYNDFRALISGNNVFGQVSDQNVSIPRAAIVANNATNVDIIGNKVTGGYGGIAATAQFAGVINIASNSCTTGASSLFTVSCLRLSSPPVTTATARIVVKDNFFETLATGPNSGSAIYATSSSTAKFSSVEISGNTINGSYTGLNFASQYVTGSFTLKNNNFGGVADNVMATIASLTGAPAVIMGNVFDSTAGNNGNGLVATSSNIHMANNKFVNRTSGTVSMFNGAGSCGTIMGTQFNNVVQAAQVTAGSLGTSNPSACTLNYNDFVQNLTPSELGAAASKYVEFGWLHVQTVPSGNHLPQRALTGN